MITCFMIADQIMITWEKRDPRSDHYLVANKWSVQIMIYDHYKKKLEYVFCVFTFHNPMQYHNAIMPINELWSWRIILCFLYLVIPCFRLTLKKSDLIYRSDYHKKWSPMRSWYDLFRSDHANLCKLIYYFVYVICELILLQLKIEILPLPFEFP